MAALPATHHAFSLLNYYSHHLVVEVNCWYVGGVDGGIVAWGRKEAVVTVVCCLFSLGEAFYLGMVLFHSDGG